MPLGTDLKLASIWAKNKLFYSYSIQIPHRLTCAYTLTYYCFFLFFFVWGRFGVPTVFLELCWIHVFFHRIFRKRHGEPLSFPLAERRKPDFRKTELSNLVILVVKLCCIPRQPTGIEINRMVMFFIKSV